MANESPSLEEAPLHVSVRWGLGGTSSLPEEVEEIEIVRCDTVDQVETCTSPLTCTVAALTATRPGGPVEICRPAEGTELYMEQPVLLQRGLPTGVPIRFILRGKAAGETTHVGQVGPFLLGEGERRFVELRMYPVGTSWRLPAALLRRFLHTATPLPDGRILVAGGFVSVNRLGTCPTVITSGEWARCYELVATDEAAVFDVASGTVTPIRNAMLAPRAGHTATALPDGRVLLTGGAPRAVLAMIPQDSTDSGEFRIEIVPRREDARLGAHASFELFDAFMDAEVPDLERDGDPGRGRFLGTAGGNSPGALHHARFMHAATAVPSVPARVLLIGGLGEADSASTYEVFDADKPGGYGVRRGADNRLTVPRAMPSAIALAGRVWIFGGGPSRSNRELADVWTGGETDPNGSVSPASEVGAFPSSVAGMEADHPEYSLVRPLAVAVDGGKRALVAGWYGPLCVAGLTSPSFSPGDGAVACDAPVAPATRSFTVEADTGLTAPTLVSPRAFGASAELHDFEYSPSRRLVAFTGGIASTTWAANFGVEFFGGDVDESGAAEENGELRLDMQVPRVFHTANGVPGWGLVTIGGMTYDAESEAITFVEEAEVFFLTR